MFDLTALRMQLALAEGNMSAFERHRQRMVDIAMVLEEKTTIPAVKAQLEYLASMQESGFWEGIDLHGLEALRLCLRKPGALPRQEEAEDRPHRLPGSDHRCTRSRGRLHAEDDRCPV